MDNNQLSLDDIVEQAKQDGIFWDIDKSLAPIVRYKFAFDGDLIEYIVTTLTENFHELGHKIKSGRMQVSDRKNYVVFDDNVSIYTVDSLSPIALRRIGKDIQKPSTHQILLVIDVLETDTTPNLLLNLMRTFYETYKNTKTLVYS